MLVRDPISERAGAQEGHSFLRTRPDLSDVSFERVNLALTLLVFIDM